MPPVVHSSRTRSVVCLVLFVFALRGRLGAGLPSGGDTATYLEYVVPGITFLAVGGRAVRGDLGGCAFLLGTPTGMNGWLPIAW